VPLRAEISRHSRLPAVRCVRLALEPAGGPPSFDLRRMIRPELFVQILPAIGETSKSGVPSRRNVRFDAREISIEVVPLSGADGRPSFLILFDVGPASRWSGARLRPYRR